MCVGLLRKSFGVLSAVNVCVLLCIEFLRQADSFVFFFGGALDVAVSYLVV